MSPRQERTMGRMKDVTMTRDAVWYRLAPEDLTLTILDRLIHDFQTGLKARETFDYSKQVEYGDMFCHKETNDFIYYTILTPVHAHMILRKVRNWEALHAKILGAFEDYRRERRGTPAEGGEGPASPDVVPLASVGAGTPPCPPGGPDGARGTLMGTTSTADCRWYRFTADDPCLGQLCRILPDVGAGLDPGGLLSYERQIRDGDRCFRVESDDLTTYVVLTSYHAHVLVLKDGGWERVHAMILEGFDFYKQKKSK